MINPKLEIGDIVRLLHMDGESLPPGILGKVTKVSHLRGETIYEVDWENGNKKNLLSDLDIWDKEMTNKKQIKEVDEFERTKRLMKNSDVFKHFNMKFLKDYLIKVRDSGITNMFGAAPYLYLGKDRIEHEFKYKEIHDEDSFNEVLENANMAQAEMIRGVMNVLDHEGKEQDLNTINRYLQRYASKVLENYMNLF
jgi:hypothetical protein